MIVAGTVMGSAIFLVPSTVANALPHPVLIAAVWIFAGVLTWFGALAFAELGAMYPASGGQYVYLRESWGKLTAFLFGWAFLLVIRSGGTATLAVGFAIYAGHFFPLTPAGVRITAVGVILILMLVNCRGVRLGAAVQNVMTIAKVLGIAILIGSALFSPQPSALQWSAPAAFSWSDFGVATIACLWAYQGWFVGGMVAGEIRRPERNLPLALSLGVGGIIVIYLSANLAYLHILSVPEVAGAERVAALMASRTLGEVGASVVSLVILVSIFGALNGGILGGSRVYFAMARDGLFFKKIGEVHPKYETPAFAILVQGVWASLLAVSGSYEKLFSYVIFSSWIFYGLAVAGVIVLRRRHPDFPRPYKMWGYPITPILFVVTSALFVANTLVTKPVPSLLGLLCVASGVPAYLFWRRSR
ncbi:MAG: amino acid permease [Verrucomicrobia bacterium]|nr:amino acid permease [Verrucomicrobiota bacterium]